MKKFSRKSNSTSLRQEVIIVSIICFTILCISVMIFVYLLTVLKYQQNQGESLYSTVSSEPFQSIDATTPNNTVIVHAPDYLASSYKESFAERYSDDILNSLYEESDSEKYFIFVRAIEKTYAKFFQSGYEAGWLDYHSGKIDQSILDKKFDVMDGEVKDISFTDGYQKAIASLSSK